ncbi:alpha-13/16-mannosyltransferase alg2 [Anaeramoeba ignava]|uniref:Alpha-1,3/1,6-mannosyltransferase ALG2 n=1 Tax=Anaeramoeba ignava TaxID=1746090 RepID=A0A9Q0LY72_ANAIG|nr:alpha-13/16-mannosyltransferase alg2 [Anaeramoeba ignava]
MTKIAFLHPELRIGGAERLVIDAAQGLQKEGYKIEMFTSHLDKKNCYKEVRDGTLAVHKYGSWIPRQIFGKFQTFLAIIRAIYLSIIVVFSSWFSKKKRFDFYFCDQVSVYIPLLRLTGKKIIFYCHFPDLLLTQSRDGIFKKIYRFPLDLLEKICIKFAHVILVNSKFTKSKFQEVFTSSKKIPQVLYPSINLKAYESKKLNENQNEKNQNEKNQNEKIQNLKSKIPKNAKVVLSINRFERKKNITLALNAFSLVQQKKEQEKINQDFMLIIAGGFDKKIKENVEYLKELEELAEKNGIKESILFVPSFTEEERSFLLSRSCCVVYTPSNEHFGIVPLEAMFAGCPVVGVNSGGPLETIIDGETGFLSQPDPKDFSQKLWKILTDDDLRNQMKSKGPDHVRQNFSLEIFSQKLSNIIKDMIQNQKSEKKKKQKHINQKFKIPNIKKIPYKNVVSFCSRKLNLEENQIYFLNQNIPIKEKEIFYESINEIESSIFFPDKTILLSLIILQLRVKLSNFNPYPYGYFDKKDDYDIFPKLFQKFKYFCNDSNFNSNRI